MCYNKGMNDVSVFSSTRSSIVVAQLYNDVKS